MNAIETGKVLPSYRLLLLHDRSKVQVRGMEIISNARENFHGTLNDIFETVSSLTLHWFICVIFKVLIPSLPQQFVVILIEKFKMNRRHYFLDFSISFNGDDPMSYPKYSDFIFKNIHQIHHGEFYKNKKIKVESLKLQCYRLISLYLEFLLKYRTKLISDLP